MYGNRVTAGELGRALRDARRRTLELIQNLDDEQLMGPRLPIVNPLLWEIGHVAWFQERWVLRHLRGQAPIRDDGDSLYDSNAIPHDTRWDLPLPSRTETLAYMAEVSDRILDALQRVGEEELAADRIYFHQLALFHEDMHDEAFTYARQTLGYPAPGFVDGRGSVGASGSLPGDVELAGGRLQLGSAPEKGFVFDNEKWAHPVEVRPFRIARAPVTQGEFLAFVEDDGYLRRELWTDAGWEWRESQQVARPVYWRNDAHWRRRRFDEWIPLEPHLPVIHVNWYEATAYTRWAGRRLPTESEWEFAACGGRGEGEEVTYPWGGDTPDSTRANLDGFAGGCVDVGAHSDGDTTGGVRQMVGNVWEWTQSDFLAYPGFSADPYAEYSSPWFGTQKVLHGGCWVTRSRLIRNAYRNFYTPDRRDVWAGFRTCAVD